MLRGLRVREVLEVWDLRREILVVINLFLINIFWVLG